MSIVPSNDNTIQAGYDAILEKIYDIALEKYPRNHIVDDPHGATGYAESDPYGDNEAIREAFIQGAFWRHVAPQEVAVEVELRTRVQYLEDEYTVALFSEGFTLGEQWMQTQS